MRTTYEVWQSDESGFDHRAAVFTDLQKAYDYINHLDRYYPGFHHRLITVTE